MELSEIREHWETWAREHGTGLRATTKSSTAKLLEIDALYRSFVEYCNIEESLDILEMGCGNGHNCFQLMTKVPNAKFVGLDYVPEMIKSANSLKVEYEIADDRLMFQVANVLELSRDLPLFDIVFTDRCLINLNSTSLQIKAIANLVEKIKPGGHLFMIENSVLTYGLQNEARIVGGLEARKPADFNHFFDDESILQALEKLDMCLLEIEDFISLHDLILYVLVPMSNGGNIEYDHPLVAAATKFSACLSANKKNAFGSFGQNRLYKLQKNKN